MGDRYLKRRKLQTLVEFTKQSECKEALRNSFKSSIPWKLTRTYNYSLESTGHWAVRNPWIQRHDIKWVVMVESFLRLKRTTSQSSQLTRSQEDHSLRLKGSQANLPQKFQTETSTMLVTPREIRQQEPPQSVSVLIILIRIEFRESVRPRPITWYDRRGRNEGWRNLDGETSFQHRAEPEKLCTRRVTTTQTELVTDQEGAYKKIFVACSKF